MKICLVTPSPVPFVMGGAEKLFLGLVEAINHHTSHVADLIKIPVFEQGFWGLVDGYRLFAELDLSHFDLVLSTKYPAWMIRHKNHHVYLQHKLRGFYDLYQAAPQGLRGGEPPSTQRALPDHPSLQGLLAILDRSHPDRKDMHDLFVELGRLRHLRLPENIFAFPGPLIRRVVHFLDQIGLSQDNIVSYSAISRTVANRKDYFPAGIPVRVLHHPTSLKGLAPGTKQDYLFTASRLSELKRLHLLVAAYAKVPGNLPFLIAGTGAEEFTLARQAAHDPRIQFLGFVPDAQLSQLYRDALAVPFVPYDEDYGLITLEAMRCAKPVLTCSDSGGVTELVQSGVTGEIAAPTVESIAGLLASLVENPARSRDLGRNALERVRPITWSNFVRDLLDQVSLPRIVRTSSTSDQQRGHILVLSTFGVHPPVQGGQLRIFHLYRQLANHYDVTILSLGNLDAPEEAIELAPGYVEHRIPRVKAQAREEMRLRDLSGISCGDIMAISHWAQNNRFMDVLQEYLSAADCVVLSHPYLAHALQECWNGPVVYDAHNVEYDLKKPFLSGLPELLDGVRTAEALALKKSRLVLACSAQDRERLIELYGVAPQHVLVVENGVDPTGTQHFDEQARQDLKNRLRLAGHHAAVFVGSYHGPNIEAVRHILDMAPRCPDWIFLVVGSVEAAFRNATLPDNVRMLEQLDDTKKNLLLHAADLGLNPVTSGSGTNMKVLDYAIHHLPILSTPFGLRGLELDQRHVLVREIQEFADAMSSCRSVQATTLAKNAYDEVQKKYAWSALGQKCVAGFKSVLA